MILLDTQALVWIVERNPRLGARAAQLEAESEQVAASAASAWELGLLVSRGKLQLSMPIEAWLETVFSDDHAVMLPVTRAIALDAGLLPPPIHGDPGDRFVIATARALNCPLLTSDRKILAYAEAGHLRAIDASL